MLVRVAYILNCVVRNTNGAGLALGELGHGLPSINNGNAIIDFDIAPGDSAVLDEREVLVAGLEGNGPVHEVKVKVVEFEFSKAVIESLLDNVGVMLAVP
jgi:hypothetical protein